MQRDRSGGKVPAPLGCRQGLFARVTRSLADRQLLVTHEAKKLVLNERTAHGEAKLISLQLVSVAREEVAGIELGVPNEPKGVAMELIRAGLDHHVRSAARKPALLHAHIAGLGAELLDRVGEREVQVIVHQ